MPTPATADENTRRRYESPAIAQGIVRQVNALVTRCEEGDTEALEALTHVTHELERATFEGVRALYRAGYTWQQIGDLLGITRQAASQRFRESVTP